MTNEKYSVIIDTDPGIDDSAAILWLLGDKRFDIKALTITHGNIGVEGCAANALRILDIAGRLDIPVYKGAEKPILKDPISASYAHGQDGLGDVDIPYSIHAVAEGWAPAEIVRIARSSCQKITILAIGPLTNIAIALLADPDLPRYVEKIVFMGGAVRVRGNITVTASFNVYSDPEAAEIVYQSGITLVQIGLDVCNLLRFSAEDIRSLADSSNAVAATMALMAGFRISQMGKTENRSIAEAGSIALNDVAAAAYLINPDWFCMERASGKIVMDGLCRGMTVLDFDDVTRNGENIFFASDVSAEDAVSSWVSGIRGFRIRG